MNIKTTAPRSPQSSTDILEIPTNASITIVVYFVDISMPPESANGAPKMEINQDRKEIHRDHPKDITNIP
jgi:hypothetical protein